MKNDNNNIVDFEDEKEERSSYNYDQIAQALRNWAMDPKSIFVVKFFTNINMPESVFYRAVKKHKGMKEAYEFAKNRIACNIHDRVYEKSLNMQSAILFKIRNFDKEWKEEQDRRDNLQLEMHKLKLEQQKQLPEAVEIPFEKTKEVKEALERKNKSKGNKCS